MKALTFHRPWPHSILKLGKRIENRTWPLPKSRTGEWIALHAGKAWDSSGANFIADQLPHLSPLDHFDLFNKERHAPPQIVATVRFSGCVHLKQMGLELAMKSPLIPVDQQNWAFGPFCWLIEEVIVLDRPIRIRGAQGFWNVPDQARELIEYQHGIPFR